MVSVQTEAMTCVTRPASVGQNRTARVPQPQPDRSMTGSGHHWSGEEDSIVTQQGADTDEDDLCEGWEQDGLHVQHLYVFIMLKCALSKTFNTLIDVKMCAGGL